ncbi:hypothetical protein AQI95_31300 [Streptomyces yokosukanensis]|uniref:Uncharacterized protein n=1 Tax=Streptomyces yokosukanensis TaxID=67386 RepID=A0A101NY02_9ACTN|nr:hypothetical protein AQI95_31300 [Streptomyces yokosukanensis]
MEFPGHLQDILVVVITAVDMDHVVGEFALLLLPERLEQRGCFERAENLRTVAKQAQCSLLPAVAVQLGRLLGDTLRSRHIDSSPLPVPSPAGDRQRSERRLGGETCLQAGSGLPQLGGRLLKL